MLPPSQTGSPLMCLLQTALARATVNASCWFWVFAYGTDGLIILMGEKKNAHRQARCVHVFACSALMVLL